MDSSPAFSGFPRAGLDFLTRLGAHNERTWFEAHKEEYQRLVLEPAQAFVGTLGERLQKVSTGIRYDTRTDGQGVLMRIRRDTRFGPDKTPYKTNISGLFWEGSGKKTESPAFGFRLEAEGMDLMAGMFKFPASALAMYRNAVIDQTSGTALEDALSAVRQAGDYWIAGEHYKRVPAGLDPKHPRADLLRYDGLYVFSARIPASDIVTAGLVELCFGHFQNMSPIQRWLVTAIEPD